MVGIWLYLGGIVLGVLLAFYGLGNRRWLAFFAGLAIAILSTYTAGLI